MTDVKALKELKAKVEAGALAHLGGEHTLAAMPRATWEPIVKANSGSLDAAKALHDAVLPGWTWEVAAFDDAAGVSCSDVKLWNDKFGLRGIEVDLRTPEIPARAWLLAILSALIAEREG